MMRLVYLTALTGVAVALSGCAETGKPSFSPDQVFRTSPTEESTPPAAAAKEKSGNPLSSLFQKDEPEANPASSGQLALARLSERRGQPEAAERMYRKLLDEEPDNPVPYHRLAVMNARQGRFDEANKLFEDALRLAPRDARLLSDVGYCYYLQQRMEEAEKYLRQAHELAPSDRSTCNNLAMLLGEQGKYQEALAMFRRVNSEAESLANLGYVYTRRGELELAKANYDRALSLDPELRPAAEAMIQLSEFEERQKTQIAAAARDQASPAVQTLPATASGSPQPWAASGVAQAPTATLGTPMQYPQASSEPYPYAAAPANQTLPFAAEQTASEQQAAYVAQRETAPLPATPAGYSPPGWPAPNLPAEPAGEVTVVPPSQLHVPEPRSATQGWPPQQETWVQ